MTERSCYASIELRMVCDLDHCTHHWECDWGRLGNTSADPRLGIEHLMLTTGDYAQKILDKGPQEGRWGSINSVTVDGQRIFMHLDYAGRRTTWELFDAHFWDGKGPDNVLIGRWPD